ncbi:MAG TPA: terminase small subunit [Cytophagaceae bacterium]|jgi:hypothetical protein|nr:terminase small subunit [Cytophagaceae bacterium]
MGKKISKKDQESESEGATLLTGSNLSEKNNKLEIVKPADKPYLFQPGHNGTLSKRYSNAQTLECAINAYFDKCEADKKPYTTTGMALYLGFSTRSSLLNYEKEEGYEQFHDVMHRAKLRIEEQMEIHLLTKQNVAGVIFLAKNNFGYKDSTEVDLKSKNEFLTQLVATPATGKEISHEG